MRSAESSPLLSVIAPAHNEEENIRPLVEEIQAALETLDHEFEIIIINDGSNDRTADALRELIAVHDRLRVIEMLGTPRGRGHGQSAAFHAGFRAARGEHFALLDADLQNDPQEIPRLLSLLLGQEADLVQGDRSRGRQDTLVRRVSSRVGRFFRRALLGDTIRDTGCSLRVMRREVALAMPLEYRGMHRFIPITARQLGYRVIETQVSHRPRHAGKAKYGIWNRALPGLIDCLAVRWMHRRRRPVACVEMPRVMHIEHANPPGSKHEPPVIQTTVSGHTGNRMPNRAVASYDRE